MLSIIRRYGGFARQFLIFAIVGVIAAVGHFGTLALLVESGRSGLVTGSALGFVVAAAMSYALNRRFTFNATRDHKGALPRFAVVAIGGFLLNAALMEVFAVRLGIYYLLAQAMATLMVMVWNFVGYRLWAFVHVDASPNKL